MRNGLFILKGTLRVVIRREGSSSPRPQPDDADADADAEAKYIRSEFSAN